MDIFWQSDGNFGSRVRSTSHSQQNDILFCLAIKNKLSMADVPAGEFSIEMAKGVPPSIHRKSEKCVIGTQKQIRQGAPASIVGRKLG